MEHDEAKAETAKDEAKPKRSISDLKDQFLRVHDLAVHKPDARPYMSIPANPERDADLIIMDALNELGDLRASLARVEKERDDAAALITTMNEEALKVEQELAAVRQANRALQDALVRAKILAEKRNEKELLALLRRAVDS